MEVQYNKSIQILCANKREEFISAKLKNFYNMRKIKIKYIVCYLYKNNGIIKQDQKTIAIIKDFLLINIGLLLKFSVSIIDIAYYFQNQLLTKYQIGKLILKKCWTG